MSRPAAPVPPPPPPPPPQPWLLGGGDGVAKHGLQGQGEDGADDDAGEGHGDGEHDNDEDVDAQDDGSEVYGSHWASGDEGEDGSVAVGVRGGVGGFGRWTGAGLEVEGWVTDEGGCGECVVDCVEVVEHLRELPFGPTVES